MLKKSNVKKPDRVILFEIGIIIALLFVNYGLNISYQSDFEVNPVPTEPPIDAWVIQSHRIPVVVEEEKPVDKVKKIIELASVFDPAALIKQVDHLINPKELLKAPSLPSNFKMIQPLVIKTSPDTSNKIITFSSVMPEFPGGKDALYEYIIENFEIPEIIYETHNKVSLVVEFVVRKNGKVSDFKVIETSAPGMGTERSAKKLYENMPTWSPGVHNGREANVRLVQPITIQIY